MIEHRVSFLDEYIKSGKSKGACEIASGAFLRIDIPIILKKYNYKDENILYTDVDIIFMKDPVFDIKPKYFACCSESDKNPNNISMNSGVMYLNVIEMYKTYNSLIDFMIKNNFKPPDNDLFDQGQLIAFYKNKWDHLPIVYNWKPYWGINNDAIIIHFHGPKPFHLERIFMKQGLQNVHIYHQLLHQLNNNIDWKKYIESYPDLINANINTQKDALNHWTYHGIYEKRIFPSDQIVPTINYYINLYNKYNI